VANATINDLQRQLNNLPETLSNTAAQQAAADAGARSTKKQTAKTAAVDKRYAQLQTQLTDQQRQLRETQDLIAKNHRELQGSLNSTRDELNGSIAKTHDELVVLAKRGERSYFEFDLAKSKDFQRIGPLPLSLRKTDTKHSSFDMAMVVDDNQLMKEKVNLYEPIWIHTENESQPMQAAPPDQRAVSGQFSASLLHYRSSPPVPVEPHPYSYNHSSISRIFKLI
jgi:hypothetical protein